MPEIPGLDDNQKGSTVVLVHERPEVPEELAYTQDDSMPFGTLIGNCRFTGRLIERRSLPGARKLELANGPMAIPDPEPGEVKYYDNFDIHEGREFGYDHRTPREIEFVPWHVVIRVRGLRKGPHKPLNRPTILLLRGAGQFSPQIVFCPLGERTMFGSYHKYPTDLLVTALADGTKIHAGVIKGLDPGTILPLGGGGTHFTKRPDMEQTEPLTEPGGYLARSTRHKWKKAWVFVVDNPYAAVCGNSGEYRIPQLPLGEWEVEAWHPLYQAVKPVQRITIRQDENTELLFEFKPPAAIVAGK